MQIHVALHRHPWSTPVSSGTRVSRGHPILWILLEFRLPENISPSRDKRPVATLKTANIRNYPRHARRTGQDGSRHTEAEPQASHNLWTHDRPEARIRRTYNPAWRVQRELRRKGPGISRDQSRGAGHRHCRCEGMYNIITRNIDTEVSAACPRYGLDIVTYNAVGGGLFSGNIRQGVTPEDGRLLEMAMLRLRMARFMRSWAGCKVMSRRVVTAVVVSFKSVTMLFRKMFLFLRWRGDSCRINARHISRCVQYSKMHICKVLPRV